MSNKGTITTSKLIISTVGDESVPDFSVSLDHHYSRRFQSVYPQNVLQGKISQPEFNILLKKVNKRYLSEIVEKQAALRRAQKTLPSLSRFEVICYILLCVFLPVLGCAITIILYGIKAEVHEEDMKNRGHFEIREECNAIFEKGFEVVSAYVDSYLNEKYSDKGLRFSLGKIVYVSCGGIILSSNAPEQGEYKVEREKLKAKKICADRSPIIGGSTHSLEEMKKEFEIIDTNHDGMLSRDELIAYYSGKYEKMTKKEVEMTVDNLFFLADADNNNLIDLNEFCSDPYQEAVEEKNEQMKEKTDQSLKTEVDSKV